MVERNDVSLAIEYFGAGDLEGSTYKMANHCI